MRGPADFEAGELPTPSRRRDVEHGPSWRDRALRGRLRARRLRRRVRRAPRRAAACTRPCGERSRPSRTSSTAAPPEPTRARATVPASSCRSPTRSSAGSSARRCRRPGRYGVAMCFLPQEAERRRELESLLAGDRRRTRARLSSAGATSPSTRRSPAAPRRASAPVVRQLVVAAGGGLADDQDAFERKLYVIRRRFELEGGADAIVPSFSSRTIVYKGMLTAPQLRGYYPDLQDERTETRARARPLPVLDQHLPELGARPPVPDDRPQRRDQHGAREHQLDAGARVAARVGAVRRRPPQGAARSSRRAARTRPRSTTCSSCSCSAAARCRTR